MSDNEESLWQEITEQRQKAKAIAADIALAVLDIADKVGVASEVSVDHLPSLLNRFIRKIESVNSLLPEDEK